MSNREQAELTSTSGVASESARVLTEKLALARELATLKPEVEHLRSQALHQHTVLAEKLSLERQLNTLEVELEAEKRAASKRAAQKNQNHEREVELQAQIETLQKDLAKEKRTKDKDRKEAEAELQSQIDTLQKDIARERREKEKARKDIETELQGQIEVLQKDLAKERREKDKARKNAEADLQNQIDELQESLAREKREREKAKKEAKAEFQSQLDDLERQLELAREKRGKDKAGQETELRNQVDELQKSLAREKREREKDRKEAETEREHQLEELQKDLARENREQEKLKKQVEKDVKASKTKEALLESKLDQFRTKLRSTKERLKECETELAQARAAAAKSGPPRAQGGDLTKNPRKRTATEMTSDFTIGTPDGADRRRKPGVKRSRMDQTTVGEKSMFSITPFLNRTMNIALDGKADALEVPCESDADEPLEPPYASVVSKPAEEEPLGTADVEEVATVAKVAPKPAPKPRGRKKAGDKESHKVLGEAGPRVHNMKLPLQETGKLTTVEEEEGDDADFKSAASKQAKVSENTNIIQTAKLEVEPKMKKRKVLGKTKTLFDEDDAEATKRPAKINLGAPQLLAKGRSIKAKVSLQPKAGAMSEFGAFSPLKKDRRGVGASFLA